MRLYKRDKVWWVDMVIKGARTRRSTNCANKGDAKMVASLILSDVITGGGRARLVVQAAFSRAWEEHWKMLRYDGLWSTLDQIVSDLRGLYVDELTTQVLANYRDKRIADGDAPATVKRKLACLSRMLSMACEWGLIDVKPTMPTLRIPKDTRVRSLTDSELNVLWASLQECGSVKPWLFMVNTGLRLSELANLRWRDVHTTWPGWRTKHDKPDHIKVWETKGGVARAVPLNDTARATLPVLSKYEPDAPVWGASLKGLRAHWKASGVPHRIHDLRHTYAVNMLAKHDIYKVQKWLGHASITTTERYCKLRD